MIKIYSLIFLCWFINILSALGQTIEIPQKVQFANLELHLDESARMIIGQKTKYLTNDFLRYQNYQQHGRIYFPFVEEAAKKYNVPDDFKYLLLLETNQLAHNPLEILLRPDSEGFWQLRKAEARNMKLTVSEYVDERNHIILATDAVMKRFSENNYLLKNWVHTLLTKELGFTRTSEIIDRSLANQRSMNITKENHAYILNFLAHYITFKGKINPDPNAVKLVVYQGNKGDKIQEISHKIALKENIVDYNLWNISPNQGLIERYPVLLPVMPNEEKKVSIFLENSAIEQKRKSNGEKDASQSDLEKKQETTSHLVVQKFGDYPILKNQQTKTIRGEKFVFVNANGLSAIIPQKGQSVSDLAKVAKIPESKFLKYNEIINKNLQTGLVYYLEKKRKKAPVKTHVLKESEDLTDVAQMYGILKSSIFNYNALTENAKYIKYQKVLENDAEIMGQEVEENDSIFIGGRVLHLQSKITGSPKFQFLRKIKKYTPPKSPTKVDKTVVSNNTRFVISKPTASTPILLKNVSLTSQHSTHEKSQIIETKGTKNIEIDPIKRQPVKRPITSDYYIAQPGDTWSGIAYMFNIKQRSLYQWNHSNAKKILYAGQKVRITPPPAAPQMPTREYTVAKGETLGQIAKRFGITEARIIKRNMLRTKKLPAGCKIYFGKPKAPQTRHTVQTRENVFSIARMYGISFRKLLAWNNMSLDHQLRQGQRLILKPQEMNTASVNSYTNPRVVTNHADVAIVENKSPRENPRTGQPDIADPATLTLMILNEGAEKRQTNKTPTATTSSNSAIYEVQQDAENIYEIASMNGITISQLKEWNNLPNNIIDFPKGTRLKVRSTSPQRSNQPIFSNKVENQEAINSNVPNEVTETRIETQKNETEVSTNYTENTPQDNAAANMTDLIVQDKLNEQRQHSETRTDHTPQTNSMNTGSNNVDSSEKNLDISHYHEVEFGEPLETVLEKYKITEQDLIKWNPELKAEIKSGLFYGGEKLIIKKPNQ